MAENYQVLEELGSGSFGVVYKAIERATGDIVAIKLVSRAPQPLRYHLVTGDAHWTRSIWNRATMISRIFSKKSPC